MSGLVARWGMGEGAGTTVGDSIATAANGTITGTGYSWVAGAPFDIVPNQAPVVSAGPDQVVLLADGATLDGVRDRRRPARPARRDDDHLVQGQRPRGRHLRERHQCDDHRDVLLRG